MHDPMPAAAPRSPNRGWRWDYAAALLAMVAFIIYGSLFPFSYPRGIHLGRAARHLLSTWLSWDGRGDLTANIALYAPLGFFLAQMLPKRLSASARVLPAALLGAGLASCIELLQYYDPNRVSSLGDVYANAIGATAGALLALALGPDMRWPLVGRCLREPGATLVLLSMFGYRLYPYVPTIGLHKYVQVVHLLLAAPTLAPGALVQFAVVWLAVAAVTEAMFGPGLWLLLFPLLAMVEFGGQVLLIAGSLSWADILGAVLAFAVWTGFLRGRPGRFAIAAGLLGTLLVALRVLPLGIIGTPLHFFAWTPFAAMPQLGPGVLLQAFCAKFFLFGGLIWLLRRAGVALPIGTAVTCALLLATRFVQTPGSGHAAALSDPVLGLLIGALLLGLRGAGKWLAPRAASAPRRG